VDGDGIYKRSDLPSSPAPMPGQHLVTTSFWQIPKSLCFNGKVLGLERQVGQFCGRLKLLSIYEGMGGLNNLPEDVESVSMDLDNFPNVLVLNARV
jgi:hypothetical protein